MKKGKATKTGGQVIVEMLLILPVFMTIVFTIMEMGNLAFQMILLNHATWEVARIGAMIAVPPGGRSGPVIHQGKLQDTMRRIVASARITARIEPTIPDRQAGITANDLVVTSMYPVPLIFPISNFMLSQPLGSGHRNVTAEVRLPIEQPLLK